MHKINATSVLGFRLRQLATVRHPGAGLALGAAAGSGNTTFGRPGWHGTNRGTSKYTPVVFLEPDVPRCHRCVNGGFHVGYDV